MADETRGPASLLRDGLDDSWFDRPEHRQVAAELRARLAQADVWRTDRGDAPTPRNEAPTGLDDSWFK